MRKSFKAPRRLSEKNLNALRRQANVSSKEANLFYYEEQLKVLNKYIDNYNAQMKTKDDYNILLIAANQELFSQTIATNITPRHLFRDRGESRANIFSRFQDQARTEIKEIQDFLSRNNPQADLEFKNYEFSSSSWELNFESLLERKEKDHLDTLKKWLPCQCGLNLLMKCLDILKKMLTQVQLTYKVKVPEGHGAKTPINRSSYLNFNPHEIQDQEKDQSDETMEFNKLSLFCSNLQYHIRAQISYCYMVLYSVFLTKEAKEVIHSKKKQKLEFEKQQHEMHDLDSIKEEEKSDRPQNQLTRPSIDRNQQFKTIIQSKEQLEQELQKQAVKDKELLTKQLQERLQYSLQRLCGFFNTQSTEENITQVAMYYKNEDSLLQDESMMRVKARKDFIDVNDILIEREDEEEEEISQIQKLRPPCPSINDLIDEMRCLVAFHFNEYAMQHFFPKKLLSKLQNIIFLTQYRLDHKVKTRRDAIGDQFTQKGNQLLADICEYYENSRSMHILQTQSNCPCQKKETEENHTLMHILSSESLVSRDSITTGNRFTTFDDDIDPSVRATEENVKSNLKTLDALLNEQVLLSRQGQQFKQIIGGFQNFTLEKAQNFIKTQYSELQGEMQKENDDHQNLHFYHQLQNEVESKLERRVTMRQIPDKQIDQRKLIFAGIFQIDRLTCDEENQKLIHPDKSQRWLFQKFFRQRIQHELLKKPNRQKYVGKTKIEDKSKESIPQKKQEKGELHMVDPHHDERDMFYPPLSQYKLKEQLDQKMHDYRKMVNEIVNAGKQSGGPLKKKEAKLVIKQLKKEFEEDLNE